MILSRALIFAAVAALATASAWVGSRGRDSAMPVKLPDAKARADVIAYLRTLS